MNFKWNFHMVMPLAKIPHVVFLCRHFPFFSGHQSVSPPLRRGVRGMSTAARERPLGRQGGCHLTAQTASSPARDTNGIVKNKRSMLGNHFYSPNRPGQTPGTTCISLSPNYSLYSPVPIFFTPLRDKQGKNRPEYILKKHI